MATRWIKDKLGINKRKVGFMARALRAWAINPTGKSSVHNLPYKPGTRLLRGQRDKEEVAQNSKDQKENTVEEALKQENGHLSPERPDQGNERQTLPPGAENRQSRNRGGSHLSLPDQKSTSSQKDGNIEEASASLDSSGQLDPDSLDCTFSYASEGPSIKDLSFERSKKGEVSITGVGQADYENHGINPYTETLSDAMPKNLEPITGGGGAGDTSSHSVTGGGSVTADTTGDTSSSSVTGDGGAIEAAGDTSSNYVNGDGGGVVAADAADDNSIGSITGDAAAAPDAVGVTSFVSVTGGTTAAGDTSSGSVNDGGPASDAAAASSGGDTATGAASDADATSSSLATGVAANGGAPSSGSAVDGEVGGGAASSNIGGDNGALRPPENLSEGNVAQGDNSLPSLTTTPIQEERQGTDTIDVDTTQNRAHEGEEGLRNEETALQGNEYEQFLVSNKVQENTFLQDKLVCKLDYTAHRCIRSWEHLACTQEINAPLEIRLRCKLNSRSSCTRTLIDFLAVEKGDETVQDLIAALKDIRRNDVVKVVKDVYQDTQSSTQSLSDFVASDANNDLIEKITTKLDERSRVNACWIDLGRKFQVSGEKLKEIEVCGESNPTEALMEYLYTKQKDLTVRKFHDTVKELKRGDVLKKLTPFFQADPEKHLCDAIDLDSDEMKSICVDLNTPNRALKNWRHLANALKVPRETYSDFNPQQPKSPTKELLKWIFAERNELTVGQLCAALASIGRNDVVRDLRNYFEPPP